MQHNNSNVVEFRKLHEVVQVFETLVFFYLSLKLVINNLSPKHQSFRFFFRLLQSEDLRSLSNAHQRHSTRALVQPRLNGQLISPVRSGSSLAVSISPGHYLFLTSSLTDDHGLVWNLLDETFLLCLSDVEVKTAGKAQQLEEQQRRHTGTHTDRTHRHHLSATASSNAKEALDWACAHNTIAT